MDFLLTCKFWSFGNLYHVLLLWTFALHFDWLSFPAAVLRTEPSSHNRDLLVFVCARLSRPVNITLFSDVKKNTTRPFTSHKHLANVPRVNWPRSLCQPWAYWSIVITLEVQPESPPRDVVTAMDNIYLRAQAFASTAKFWRGILWSWQNN